MPTIRSTLEFRRKTNGIAQRAIMRITDGGIGVQRIAPHVQCGDVQTARADLATKCRARCGVGQQARHVAMIGRRVGAGADLQAGDLRHVANQPVHDFGKRLPISASVTKPISGETVRHDLGPLCRRISRDTGPMSTRTRPFSTRTGNMCSRCCASCNARPVRRSNSQPCHGQASIGVEMIKVHAARRSGGQTATQNTGTYRAALMRAEIVDGVHRAVPTDDADLPAVHTDGADRSVREFSECADVDAHAIAMLAGAGTSASVQP